MKNEWANRIGDAPAGNVSRTAAAMLSPLGIPVSFIADSLHLLEAAVAACEPWCAGVPCDPAEPALIVRLTAGASTATPVSFPIRVEGSRLWVGSDEIGGWADAATGMAVCMVPEFVTRDPRRFSDELLEPLVLFLLTQKDRTPVHAAALMRDGVAAVLAGPTGMGKSSLALAGAMQGWTVLGDDTVYVQTAPGLGLWSVPRPIHVFADEAPPGSYPLRLRKGRLKSAITPPLRINHAGRARLVVLERGDAVGIAPIARDAAMAGLMQLEPGFDLLGPQSAQAFAALASTGVWRLTLTGDPAAAIAALQAAWHDLAR